jgi:hypothetical protein
MLLVDQTKIKLLYTKKLHAGDPSVLESQDMKL